MSYETEENLPVTTPDEPVETPPAPAPAPETPPASVTATPSFDLNKLNESLRPLGNYQVQSHEDVVKILQAQQSGMHQAQEGRAQLEAELRRLKPLAEEHQRRTYVPSDVDMEPELQRVLTPIYQHIAHVEGRQVERDQQDALRVMRESVENLAARMPNFVTQDMKADLVATCIAQGNYDPETVFWKQHSQGYAEHVRKSAVQEAVGQIQSQNAATAGLGSPTSVAVGSVIDPATLSEPDQEKWLVDQFHRYERDSKAAERTVKEYEEHAGLA